MKVLLPKRYSPADDDDSGVKRILKILKFLEILMPQWRHLPLVIVKAPTFQPELMRPYDHTFALRRSSSNTSSIDWPAEKKILLTSSFLRQIKIWWKQFDWKVDLNYPKPLTLAIRRFLQSGRRDIEDSILDIMIGFEALLMSDIGGSAERAELRFRLALRAARLLGDSFGKRKEIFNVMRSA